MISKSRYITPVYRGRGLGRKRRRQRKFFYIMLSVLIILCFILMAYSRQESIMGIFRTPIDAPKKFSAEQIDTGEFTFKWSAVKGAKGYVIYKYNKKTDKYDTVKKLSNKAKSFTAKIDKNARYSIKSYKRSMNEDVYSENYTYCKLKTISDMIEIVGHRGAMDKAPENTLVSYKLAHEIGYKGFETDYWETYSNELIISHGKDISPATGIYENVKNLTIDSLHDYPVVRGINVDKYATQYMPAFEEAIQSAARYKMNIYLHTKNVEISDTAVEKIVSVIKKYNMQKKATVFSANRDVFLKLKEHNLRTGFLILPQSGWDIRGAIDFAGKNKADVLIMHYTKYLKKKHLREAHKYNIKVGCYDTSNLKAAFKMVDFDMDFMITNKDFIS